MTTPVPELYTTEMFLRMFAMSNSVAIYVLTPEQLRDVTHRLLSFGLLNTPPFEGKDIAELVMVNKGENCFYCTSTPPNDIVFPMVVVDADDFLKAPASSLQAALLGGESRRRAEARAADARQYLSTLDISSLTDRELQMLHHLAVKMGFAP